MIAFAVNKTLAALFRSGPLWSARLSHTAMLAEPTSVPSPRARRARRGEIAGVQVEQGDRVVFGVPGAGDGYREAAQQQPKAIVLDHDGGGPRPALVLGAHAIAGALGVFIAFMCGFMYVMAQEGARYDERYRNVSSMH